MVCGISVMNIDGVKMNFYCVMQKCECGAQVAQREVSFVCRGTLCNFEPGA